MSISAKKKIRTLAALLTVMLLLATMVVPALGASPVIDRTARGSLTVQPQYSGQYVSGCVFQIYQVATIDDTPSLHYSLTAPFAQAGEDTAGGGDGLDLSALKTAEDAKAAAGILKKYVSNVNSSDVIPLNANSTSADGNVVSDLDLGVYLVVQTSAPGRYIASAPFLVFIPTTNDEGTAWVYAVSVYPKLGRSSNPPGNTTSVSVVKEWDDAGFESQRPDSVQVGLYRNGTLYGDPVTLNDENSWKCTWNGLSENYDWTVDEIDPPTGYNVMVSGENGKYTITNSKQETPPHGGTLNVTKKWVGDSDDIRPDSIQVTLYRDGASYETVELSSENNWTYSWAGLDDASTWTMVEDNIPTGYTLAIDQADDGYTMTNTYHAPDTEIPEESPPLGPVDIPDAGTPGGSAPQTGLVQWPIPVLMGSGVVLVAAGVLTGRRGKKHEK